MLDNVWITRNNIKGSSLSPCAFESNWYKRGFSCGTSSKEPAFQCRRHKRVGSVPGSGRSPGGGHGNSLQYSCLENRMAGGAWQAIAHGFAKESDTTEAT